MMDELLKEKALLEAKLKKVNEEINEHKNLLISTERPHIFTYKTPEYVLIDNHKIYVENWTQALIKCSEFLANRIIMSDFLKILNTNVRTKGSFGNICGISVSTNYSAEDTVKKLNELSEAAKVTNLKIKIRK